MRDLDALVNLFPEDVRVGRDKVGRAHFKQWMDDTLRQQFTGTSHHIGNHIIEFESPDRAVGLVYSKNEHETPTAVGVSCSFLEYTNPTARSGDSNSIM